MLRPRNSVWIGLICLAVALPVIADETASSQSPQPGTREFIKAEGRRLVRARQWQQAADVFGLWFHALSETVNWEWSGARDKPQLERDEYRFALANFYFRHMSFVQSGWRSAVDRIIMYAKKYPEIVARLPAEEAIDPLDFSHLDLLESIWQPYRDSKLTRDEHGARVIAAVKSDPESIPALVSMMLLVDTVQDGKPLLAWEDAERLATSPWARLTIVRAAAVNYALPAETKLRIIERGWQLAPTDEEKAMLLYRAAEAVAGSSRGRSAQQVQATLKATRPIYRQFPTTTFAANARQLAVVALADSGQVEEALALVRELQSHGKSQRGGLDRALFDVSQAYFKSEQYDRSETLLLEIVRDYADTPSASRAMLGMAEVFAARNDSDQERAWLLKCAEFEQTDPTGRGIMDTDNTRSVAIQRLAAHYERDGQWAEAARWWDAWTPRSWCGTCAAGMKATRHRHLAICRLNLGEHEAAVRQLFEAFEDGCIGWAPECAALLFEIYREAGQIEDIIPIADELDAPVEKQCLEYEYFQKLSPKERQKELPAWPLRRLKQIEDLARRQDIAELQAICLEDDDGFDDDFSNPLSGWAHHAAAAALARCGDDAVASIREAVRDTEDLRPHRWLLCALGKSSSPAAMTLLKELADKEWSYGYDDLLQAFDLRGEPGLSIVRQWADEEESSRAPAVQRYLKKLAGPRIVALTWPAPPRGSLPRSVSGSAEPGTQPGKTEKTSATQNAPSSGSTAGLESHQGGSWLVVALFLVVAFISYKGLGIVQEKVFAVGYFGGFNGVVAYKIEPGGKLVGKWAVAEGPGKVYTETLSPQT